jgi:hypothetical protein
MQPHSHPDRTLPREWVGRGRWTATRTTTPATTSVRTRIGFLPGRVPGRVLPGRVNPGASTRHTDDLRPPKIRSTKEAFGGHWQRLDFDTPAITWLTCWPQPAHVALPHLRHVTCRHIGRSSWSVDRTKGPLYPRGFIDLVLGQRPSLLRPGGCERQGDQGHSQIRVKPFHAVGGSEKGPSCPRSQRGG